MNRHATLNCATKEREPFNVRCEPCGHEWTAAYTPMLMENFAQVLKGLHCPSCGGDSKKIFLAKAKA